MSGFYVLLLCPGGGGGEGAKPGPLFISDIFLVPSHEMQHHLTNHNHSYYIMKLSKDPNSVPVVGCTVKATPIGSHHPWPQSASLMGPPANPSRFWSGRDMRDMERTTRAHGSVFAAAQVSSLMECEGRDFTKHWVASRSLLLCIRAFSLLVAY